MYNKQFFIDEFKRLGLKQTDTVFVHSSYKQIAGNEGIEGGAETLIDAFIEYFGEQGLVVFPTMSWKLGYLVNDNGETRSPALGAADGFYEYGSNFDVRETPCDYLGIIPELFRKREGVVRSLCPTSSVAAYGKDARAFCEGHERAETPLNWDSPWGRLYERGAKILFLGTTMACNTFLHVVEDHASLPGLLDDYVWNFTVTDYGGRVFPVSFKRHVPHHNHYYIKVEPELCERGIAKRVTFGSAASHIVDARSEADYILRKLKEDPYLFYPEYNK
jgi:aminoglycoside 3-N-acetyltransferase